MKDLDKSGLEFVRLDAKKRIHKIDEIERRKQTGEYDSEDSD